jgi:WD repeat-containing protein 48
LASGSPENCIRLWDPRTTTKLMKLKGHTHNIRCLCLNKDGTQLLSASSDGTIRLWSLGQQRCIHTFDNLHTQGVWSLCVNEAFNKCLSSGKDAKVYLSDLRFDNKSRLICEETESVLSIQYGSNENSFWLSTTSSDIKNWNLKEISPDEISQTHNNDIKPLLNKPKQVIKGASIIKNFHILNDKRLIITKDNYAFVSIWDVLKAKKLEDLGNRVNYEQEIKSRNKLISVPNWFTVDLKLGVSLNAFSSLN